jgi:hypothetical protein
MSTKNTVRRKEPADRIFTAIYCQLSLLAELQCLGEVGDDIGNILDADGDSNIVRKDAGGNLLLCRQLLMGGRRRMNDQGLGIGATTPSMKSRSRRT